jgi:endonuclease V-like protein UPF0215 family
VGVVTAFWPPRVTRLQLHVFKRDPGEVTEAFLDLAKGEILIIDSVTICGLGFLDPSKFDRAIVVSKYVPNIRKAYSAAKRLYSSSRFEEVAEEYLERVRCVRKGPHKLCLAPYGLSFEEALEIVEERTVRRGLPEDVVLAHELASGVGRWLTKAPSRL